MDDLSHHRHDAFFKSYFGKPETLSELIQATFPESVTSLLDLSTLTVETDSYIDQELQAHFSDLCASVNTTQGPLRVYVLVEHKTYHDPLALLQILRYMVQVWSRQNSLPLTPILPLLFYHGKKRMWPPSFAACSVPHCPRT